MADHSREPAVAHTEAVTALLIARLAAAGAQVAVYRDETIPTSPAYPYGVVWATPAAPHAEAERLAGWGGDAFTSHQVTVAGLSVLDVLGAADRIITALHRQRPTVVGRHCGDLTYDGSPGRPVLDPQRAPTGQQVYSLPLFFQLYSSPSI